MRRRLEDVKRKVRSLLELAKEGSGATEPERLTARALADRIMAKHGLTESDIPEREVEARRPPPPRPAPFFVVNIFTGPDGSSGHGFSFGFDDATTGTVFM